MRGLIDDNCVFGFLITCPMNPETAVTFTRGHFNQAVLCSVVWELKCIVRPYPQTNPGMHMNPKPYAKKPPPPLPRPRSVSYSSSPLHSTKGRQRYSSIHGGHGLPPAVRHVTTATVVPSIASTRLMSPQRANHGNITETVHKFPEVCEGDTSDDIYSELNPSYGGISMLHSGRASAEGEYSEGQNSVNSEGKVSFSTSVSLQQFVRKHSKSLPARVKVIRGYYGQSEDLELITDDLYNVHFVKHQKVVTIKDTQGTMYSVPLASILQFGLVFNEQESMDGTTFHKASDIMALKVLPKVVCAMKAFRGADESSSVQKNEILKIQSIEMRGKAVLKVFSFTRNSVKVLQANCKGRFSTKPSLIRLHLPDILTCIPCKAVMFIDETVTTLATAKVFPSSILSGPILIAESKVETSLVASFSRETACEGSEIGTLLDIPLADHLANVEVAILESPSTQEAQLLCDDTKRIMREFHPSKLKYLREMRSARAARLQSLLYAEVQKGQEMVGVELESSIADKFSLPIPSPTVHLFKSALSGEERPSLAEAHLPSKESESQHVYESLPGELEFGERHISQARRWTNFPVKPKQQPSGSIAGASKKPLQSSSAQYEAVENMYPQGKPKVPPKGLKPSPKPAFVVQTEKPDVSAKPTSKLGDDSYVHFHPTAEPLQALVSLLERQSKKHEPIQHLNDMQSTLEQETQKLQSLDSQVQNLNLESAAMEKSSSSTSPNQENKQYLHSLDITQVRKPRC